MKTDYKKNDGSSRIYTHFFLPDNRKGISSSNGNSSVVLVGTESIL